MGLSEEKTAVKSSENKQIFFKSLFFVLSIYLLVNGIVFIGDLALMDTGVAMISVLGVFLVATPVYFFLKSNIKNFWRYLANMTIVHVTLFFVEFVIVFILDHNGFFGVWEAVVWLISTFIALGGVGVILLIDLIYTINYTILNGKK